MDKDRATNAAAARPISSERLLSFASEQMTLELLKILRQETRAASFHCYMAQIGIHGENGATGSLPRGPGGSLERW